MNVFTYGTLMYPEVWQAVAGGTKASVGGVLAGYEIFRIRDAEFPGIFPSSDGQVVRGVVYLDVDARSLDRLDRFEDDFYVRLTVPVACDDGQPRDAEAYIVADHERSVLTDEVWNAQQFVDRGGLQRFIDRFAGFGRLLDPRD